MIPDIEGENDTSYFEEYDDEDEHVEHVRHVVYRSSLPHQTDRNLLHRSLCAAIN